MITTTKSLSTTQLSALYDRIYDIADKLIKKHNPCKIHTKDKKLCCICYSTGSPYGRLCCGGCWEKITDHYSLFGCITKCLACKLYLCPTAKGKHRRLSNQLYRLKQFARKHSLPSEIHYFTSKEEWFKLRREQW